MGRRGGEFERAVEVGSSYFSAVITRDRPAAKPARPFGRENGQLYAAKRMTIANARFMTGLRCLK